MEKLPPRLHNFTSLIDLRICKYPGLVSLSETTLPATLKLLEIKNCTNLKFLPEEMMSSNTSLEILRIDRCHSLTSFPRGLGYIKLTRLQIWDCMNLESLPEGLHALTSLQLLEICKCPRLVSFPEGGFPISSNLREVSITECGNLNSLPDQIHSLTSIETLEFMTCPNLASFPETGLPSNCKTLTIMDCEKLEPLTSMALQRLTSLRVFTVGGFSGPISFRKWMLPTTLTFLFIESLLNLESLPDGLHNLTSLRRLTISDCPKLASLPEDGLPTTLCSICIWKCPLLAKRCQKETGEDWPKIAHIPCIDLADHRIFRNENFFKYRLWSTNWLPGY
ncbi:hypothetical protein HHK36_017215 [Tetracentron sinense]|uniref:Uncharacterized protein n=1 Tax=Tetracentron sinense TaxID=13715 RepID=A0A834Z4U1_TETSI|nr:hypothetical protein HHK36_017215 [Tetracentron sinense]